MTSESALEALYILWIVCLKLLCAGIDGFEKVEKYSVGRNG